MIKQDSISLGFTIVALFLSLYWSTQSQNFLGLFPAILLFGGVTINFMSGYRFQVENFAGRAGSVLLYTLVALAGMYAVSLFSADVSQQIVQLSGINALEYSVLMAVSEEQFFRGGLLNFMITRVGEWGGILGSAAVFAIYHLFVYAGNNGALLYVFGAGILLAYVDVRTQRLSTSILAHVANNVIAIMGV